jgi:hypothetical protein
MPVKRVYTPELLLKMRREMEAGEDFRELETVRLVVTKVRRAVLAMGHSPSPDVKVTMFWCDCFASVGRLCGSSEQCVQVRWARPAPSV